MPDKTLEIFARVVHADFGNNYRKGSRAAVFSS